MKWQMRGARRLMQVGNENERALGLPHESQNCWLEADHCGVAEF